MDSQTTPQSTRREADPQPSGCSNSPHQQPPRPVPTQGHLRSHVRVCHRYSLTLPPCNLGPPGAKCAIHSQPIHTHSGEGDPPPSPALQPQTSRGIQRACSLQGRLKSTPPPLLLMGHPSVAW